MGIIRLLLAISVVIAHSKDIFGFTLMGGSIAVESFFVISGFYMALILNEKYTGKNSYFTFISNRMLKLFPSYWFVLVLTILVCVYFYAIGYDSMVFGAYINNNELLKLPTLVYLGFINLFMFGQDTQLFLKINPDGLLHLSKAFWDVKPPVHSFVFIPQAWSLGIELAFYVIAPFLVKKSAKILGLLILLCLTLRFMIYYSGLDYDPWTYRFFPVEIMFFLCGAISYKIYRKHKGICSIHPWVGISCLTVVLIFSLFYQYIPGAEAKQWFYFIVLILSIPFIFEFTKKLEFDRFLGELSYPVYLTHLLIILTVRHIKFATPHDNHIGIVACLGSILLSIFIVKYIMTPIEAYRQRRVRLLEPMGKRRTFAS